MKNKYKVSSRNGQPAIFTDRGLVCLMEAGNQSTRGKDAAEIVAILNAFPVMFQALRTIDANAAESVDFIRRHTRAALDKAEGVQ
jgi:hypothetical protein